MKREYLLAGLMVTMLGVTACDEDYTDWAESQSHPQESAISQVQASFAAGADATIVMDDVKADSVEVISYASNTAGGGTFTPLSLLVNDMELPYAYRSGSFTVSVAQLDSLAEAVYMSRASVPRQLAVKARGVVVIEGQPLSVESGEYVLTLTPATPLAIDPEGYYIVGDFNGWVAEKMTQASEFIWQYAYENADGADQYYKFMLGSYLDWDWESGHILGVAINGDSSSSVLAVWGADGNEPGAPIVNMQGRVLIQLDVENYRIDVSKL